MDTLIMTDSESSLLGSYWVTLILAQTYTAIKKDQIEDEDIDDLLEFFEDDSYTRLYFEEHLINKKSFDIFYKYCYQAMIDYPNTKEAKAYFVDFKKKTYSYRENKLLKDYLDPKTISQLLEIGKKEKYLDNTTEKDLISFTNGVLIWWKEFLDFLKENYGKPKQEQNN